MTWAVTLDFGAREPPKQYGRMQLTDRELVRRLRERDGALPRRAPGHLRDGTCKYADLYLDEDCPWCLEIERHEQAVARALLALWVR